MHKNKIKKVELIIMNPKLLYSDRDFPQFMCVCVCVCVCVNACVFSHNFFESILPFKGFMLLLFFVDFLMLFSILTI